MQIQLSNEEKELFDAISKSSTGDILQGYIEKLIRNFESVRTQTNLSNEARIAICDLLETHLINRIKMARGEKINFSQTEYE